MIFRTLKTFIGILLLPVLWGVANSFFFQLSALKSAGEPLLILERGVLCYVLFHVLVKRPAYIYIVGHELVHVIATWICGGRVESFDVKNTGGSVVTSKTNFFIELSPYFVPIQTIILSIIYFILKFFEIDSASLTNSFIFLLGVTLALHFVMTVEVLKMHQSDVEKSGIVLSLVLIAIFNIVITTMVISPIFSQISCSGFFEKAFDTIRSTYAVIYDKLKDAYYYTYDKIASA